MVTKEVYQDLLISKLLSTIMEKWPRRDRLSRKIFIQQDGVKNHISEDDKVFKDALMEKGINTKLYMQAADSPDVNLLDLRIFRAIQSFNDTMPKNKEKLIQVVSMAYHSLTGFYPSPKSFWSCTHVKSCQKYTLYINLHTLLNILSKATLNIQELRKSIECLKR